MNEIIVLGTSIISVLSLIGGMEIGRRITVEGYKLGFRASYQIRGNPEDDDKSLLGVSNDGQEFEMAEEENKKSTNIMSED